MPVSPSPAVAPTTPEAIQAAAPVDSIASPSGMSPAITNTTSQSSSA